MYPKNEPKAVLVFLICFITNNMSLNQSNFCTFNHFNSEMLILLFYSSVNSSLNFYEDLKYICFGFWISLASFLPGKTLELKKEDLGTLMGRIFKNR